MEDTLLLYCAWVAYFLVLGLMPDDPGWYG